MSVVTKNYTFTAGATIVASEHNANFDTIYNDYNGNIDNSNLDAAANIADSKLAQITTTSKVSGAALTALASIPSAAGYIPINNGGLGADLSTASVGMIPYFAQIGTMTALAAGATSLLLMSTSATSAPVYSKATVNSMTNVLGTLSVLLSSTTVYQAATDGFLSYSYVGGNGGTNIILSDSANPPTKQVAVANDVTGMQLLAPIKKNDYWKVTTSCTGGSAAIYWMPLGS